MDSLTTDSVLSIIMALGILAAFRMMPRIMAWGIPFLSADAIKARMDNGDNILVIDVRSSDEFSGKMGHITGALNLEAANLAERLKELGDALEPHKDEPVVVACRTHNRSPRAARLLKAAGFKDVAVLKGGVMAWSHAGYPCEGST